VLHMKMSEKETDLHKIAKQETDLHRIARLAERQFFNHERDRKRKDEVVDRMVISAGHRACLAIDYTLSFAREKLLTLKGEVLIMRIEAEKTNNDRAMYYYDQVLAVIQDQVDEVKAPNSIDLSFMYDHSKEVDSENGYAVAEKSK
jgi:hypothetical protein